MKTKLSSIIAILIFNLSCTTSIKEDSKESLAQKLTREYILENTNDPKSYESIEFSKFIIDTIEFENSNLVPKVLIDTMEIVLNIATLYAEQAAMAAIGGGKDPSYSSKISTLENRLDSLRSELEKVKLEYSKNPNWVYKINHKFRAKNAMGALVINNTQFEIDSAITKVIAAKMIEN